MYHYISVWSLHTCNCFESRWSDFHVHKFDIDVLGIESHWEKLPKLEGVVVIKVGWEVEARNRRCEHDNPVTDHSSRFVSIDGIQSICRKYKYNLIWYWKGCLEEKVKNTKNICFFGQKHEITFFWRQIQKVIVLTSFTRSSISHSTGLMYLKFPHDISIREDFETLARHSGLKYRKIGH